jgi:hypothetical protein
MLSFICLLWFLLAEFGCAMQNYSLFPQLLGCFKEHHIKFVLPDSNTNYAFESQLWELATLSGIAKRYNETVNSQTNVQLKWLKGTAGLILVNAEKYKVALVQASKLVVNYVNGGEYNFSRSLLMFLFSAHVKPWSMQESTRVDWCNMRRNYFLILTFKSYVSQIEHDERLAVSMNFVFRITYPKADFNLGISSFSPVDVESLFNPLQLSPKGFRYLCPFKPTIVRIETIKDYGFFISEMFNSIFCNGQNSTMLAIAKSKVTSLVVEVHQKTIPVETVIVLNNISYKFSSCATTLQRKLNMGGYLEAFDNFSWGAILLAILLLTLALSAKETGVKAKVKVLTRVVLMFVDVFVESEKRAGPEDYVALVLSLLVTNWYKTFLTDSTTAPFSNYPPKSINQLYNASIEINFLPYFDYQKVLVEWGPMPTTLTMFRQCITNMDLTFLEEFLDEFIFPQELSYTEFICRTPHARNMTKGYDGWEKFYWDKDCLKYDSNPEAKAMIDQYLYQNSEVGKLLSLNRVRNVTSPLE